MHGPAAVGGGSRAGLWLGLLCAVLVLTWAYRERQLATTDAAKSRQAYEALARDQAQQQTEMQALRAYVAQLETALSAQKNSVAEAQAVINTVQSQSTADHAAQQELTRQLRVMQRENVRLKQDLAFFESALPGADGKTRLKDGVAMRRFEARRLGPTQVRWQALVVQAVKNAQNWQGELDLVLSGQLNGETWTYSPQAGPTAVNLLQFARLEGVITVPSDVVLKSISAKLRQGKRVLSVQTHTFEQN